MVSGKNMALFKNYAIHSHDKQFTVKPVLSGHSKSKRKLVFKSNYGIMQVKSIAECSKGSILQYFRPSLNYHWSLSFLFCLFLSGLLRLYYINQMHGLKTSWSPQLLSHLLAFSLPIFC